MTVSGVRVELPTNTPIVLLRVQGGDRYLPIWVGPVEAMAISAALEGVAAPRPQTHDLLASVISAMDATLERVVVTELHENVYFAELVLTHGEGEIIVSSRPSDAIALAVRTGASVYAHQSVLDQAGIEIQDESTDDEVERFREMLEDMTVEDFLDPGDQ